MISLSGISVGTIRLKHGQGRIKEEDHLSQYNEVFFLKNVSHLNKTMLTNGADCNNRFTNFQTLRTFFSGISNSLVNSELVMFKTLNEMLQKGCTIFRRCSASIKWVSHGEFHIFWVKPERYSQTCVHIGTLKERYHTILSKGKQYMVSRQHKSLI